MIVEDRLVEMDVHEFNHVVARNFAYFRSKLSLTLDALETMTGIRKSKLSQIENEGYKKKVDLLYIEKIAKAFRVDSDALTESNPKILSLINDLERTVYQVPVSDETVLAAVEFVKIAEDRGPKERALAFMYRGLTKYYRGLFTDASEDYEKAFGIVHFVKDIELAKRVQRNLSSSLMMIGLYGRSEELIRNVISSSTDDRKKPYDFYKLATIYYNKGEFERAERVYLETMQYAPENSVIHGQCKQVLGSINRRFKRYDEAIAHIVNSLIILKKCNELITATYSYKTLGEIYKEMGDVENAKAAFDNGVTLAKEIKRDVEELILRFESAILLDDFSEIIRLAEEARFLDIPPNELNYIYFNAAEKGFEKQQFDIARQYYRKANESLQKK